MKIYKHIQIARTNRAALSSMSQKSCDMIRGVLEQRYYSVGVSTINDREDLEQLVGSKPDLIFLGMKFISTNHALGRQDPSKIWISDYLDQHDILHTGSGRKAVELEFNKPLAKQRVINLGLGTSPFFIARQNEYRSASELPLRFPLFVKPVNMGGGMGIDDNSVVHNFADFQAKVRHVAVHFHSNALVEQYLPGREFSVAILEYPHSKKLAVMPIELIAEQNARGNRVLGQKIKSSNAESVSWVADTAIRHRVSQLASDVFRALGARDYGRIDIRMDKAGIPQFLEANLIPSLISGYGSFPKACLINLAMDYETMILRIVELGLSRRREADKDLPELEPVNEDRAPVFETAFQV